MKRALILTILTAFAFLVACDKKNTDAAINTSNKQEAVQATEGLPSNPAFQTKEETLFSLADKYYFGKDGYEQNYKKAFELFDKAYRQEESESCSHIALGNMYYAGKGVTKDINKAFKLWSKYDDCNTTDGNNAYSFEAYNHIKEHIIEKKDKDRAFEMGNECFGRDSRDVSRCGHASSINDDNRDPCEQGEAWYKLAAELGHPEAKVRLANNYLTYANWHHNCYTAFNTDSDDDEHRHEGEKLLLSAANQGYADAMEELGDMYFYGRLPMDHQKAEQWLLKAANKGKGYSALMLARLYSGGKDSGIPADYHKAFYWANQAVQKGIDAGNYYLGLLYDNGQGVAKDRIRALQLFKKVKDGYEALLAGFMLQQLYVEGVGTAQDYKALAKEDGRCYYYFCTKGWIFDKDNYTKVKEKTIWQAAFEKDDILAQLYLVNQYTKDPNDPDKQEAALLKALIALHPEPKDELTKTEWKSIKKSITDKQKEVPSITDYEHASKSDLIKAATLKNDTHAQRVLGRRYILQSQAGEKFSAPYEQLLTQATEWYFLAARSGDSIAQVQLASMYGKGNIGLYREFYDPNTIPEEIYWLEQAAKQGNPIAEYELANKYYTGVLFTDEQGAIYSQSFRQLYVMRNLQKAFELYKRSAEAGYVPAMKKLSYMYEHGEYVNPDYTEHMYWKKKVDTTKVEKTLDDEANLYTTEK